jgi:opacity protein-like surface antigen
VATSTAFAQAKNFEGPSAALAFGATGINSNISSTYVDNGTPGSNSIDTGKTNFISGLDLSYAKAVDANWLLGFGVTYDFNKSKSGTFAYDDGPGQTGSISLTGKNHYSVYFQPTYALNNTTALFAKVGYHSIKGTITAVGDEGNYSAGRTFTGVGYGVGVKTFLNKNIYVQAEAQIVDFGKKSETDGDYTQTVKIKSTAGILSIGYKF